MLELAGHTHGGQIRGLDLLTKWANHGFLSGLYRVGAMTLYVSNGTGLWNGFAIRIGRPSEITQVVLRANRCCARLITKEKAVLTTRPAKH